MPPPLTISYFVFLIVSLLFASGAVSLGIGSAREPGPGFVPLIAAVILAVCCVFALFKNSRTIRKRTENLFKPVYLKKAALVYAAIVFYMMAIKHLGYPITTFLFMLFLMKGIEPQKWSSAVLYSALASGFSYLIFVVFLKVQFL